MAELFGRSWRVQVADVVIKGDLYTPSVPVSFDITRDTKPTPNDATVVIRNLSETTRTALQQAGEAGNVYCAVEAGYIDARSEIFRGDLRNVRNYRDGTSWITEVTSGDGEHSRRARTGRSYPPGSKPADVIAAIAKDLGVGVGNLQRVLTALSATAPPPDFEAGRISDGVAWRELTRMLGSLGLEWSIQSGQLQVLSGGAPLQGVPAVKLTPTSGLQDSPQPGGKKGTVKARAKIIPGLVPGWPVQIESRYISGIYRIERCTPSGDSVGGQWECGLELKEVRT